MSDATETEIELSIEAIKKRAVKGVAFLTGRTFLIQVIGLAANFLLTLFLEPAQYGTYVIVTAVIGFFTYFSDIGLAASLIQKKETPTDTDLKTTFTVQQIIVFILVLIIILATPLFQSFYGFNQQGVYLLWALALSFIFSSLKTIPSVLLERKLNFDKLVIPQIVETLLFNVVAVTLAWKGFGVMSFTAAVVVRGFSGLVLMYYLQPWKIGFKFSRDSLANLLKFGIPYQLNTFLAVIKDDGMTLILGGILGTTGVSFLGWAQRWAAAPLRFFMDQVVKVTFPAFARMQDQKKELQKAVNSSIFFICLLVFPMMVGLLTLAQPLVSIIPKYSKWQPALIPLYLISINIFWASISTPLTNMLSAVGKIKTTFKLMAMWVVLTWALVPILSIYIGVNGAALGFALVGLSSVITVFVANKVIKINFISSIGRPLLSSLAMVSVMELLKSVMPINFVNVLIFGLLGLLVYTGVIMLIARDEVTTNLQKILKK